MLKERVQITIRFSVEKEFVPGLFYDPQDFADKTADDIKYRLESYKPLILEKSVKD